MAQSVRIVVFLVVMGLLPPFLSGQELFSPYVSGDSFESVVEKIKADPLLAYRESQVTMAVPVVRDNEVFYEIDEKVRALAVQGRRGYLQQVFFHFTDEKLASMTVTFSPKFTSYYEVFLKLQAKFGTPVTIKGPGLIEWEAGESLIRLERPITVKYVDLLTVQELRAKYEKDRKEDMDIKNAILDRL